MEVGDGWTILLLFSHELGFQFPDAEEEELRVLHDFLIFSASDIFIEFDGWEWFFGWESVSSKSIILAIMKGLNEVVDGGFGLHPHCLLEIYLFWIQKETDKVLLFIINKIWTKD